MAQKQKTYVLMVSAKFPSTHPKAGKETNFEKAIAAALYCEGLCNPVRCKNCGHYKFLLGEYYDKKHTIRKNYPLWKKRIDEVNKGNAVLSLRQWEGEPRKSKQIEFLRLVKGEVAIQKLNILSLNGSDNHLIMIDDYQRHFLNISDLAFNDGLEDQDFLDWFGDSLFDEEPKAIIHFTDKEY